MMDKFNIKKYNGIFHVLSVLLLLFIAFKVFVFLLPFVLALIVVSISKPIIKFLSKKIKINSHFLKSFVLIFIYVVIGSVIVFSIFRIVLEAYRFSTYIFNNQTLIIENIKDLFKELNSYNNLLPKNIAEYTTNLLEKTVVYITKSLLSIFSASLFAIKKLPNILIFIFIMILSSLVIVNDDEKIVKYLEKQFPKSWLKKMDEIKNGVLVMLVVYLKAQLILILLCFFELLIGLSIISAFVYKLDYVLLFAFIICFMEAMPLIGAGIILFPWIFFSLVYGNYKLAIALLILEIIVVAARQLLEPKLISSGAKTHPLLTLIAIYSGFKFFGILGFLIGPIILSILKIVFYDEIEYGFFKFLIAEKSNDEDNN